MNFDVGVKMANKITFTDLVREELIRARRQFKPINSPHEGKATIEEEFDEYWDEAKKKQAKRSKSKMLEELVQVAAMAQRTAEDLGFLED